MTDNYAQGVGQAAAAGAMAGAQSQAQEQATGLCSCAIIDRPFIKSVPGILKIVQMILSLIGFICVAVGNKEACPYGSAFGWYQFVAMGAFWSTFALYCFLILKCHDRCCSCTWFNWLFIEFIYLIIVIACWAIAALVLSAQNCGNSSFQAGAAFGYFATAAYAANQFFIARDWWQSRQQAKESSATASPGGQFDQPSPFDEEAGKY